jgi:large conductance mechanosensitive channel
MLKEFKAFIDRGNLLQLAAAFIMGVTFAAVITSLVNDVIMPLVGLGTGGVDFASHFVVLKYPEGASGVHYATVQAAHDAGAVTLNWGMFINAIIVFIIVALVLFLLVKAYNKANRPKEAAVTTKSCPYCFTDIPLAAVRCPNCTSELTATSGS